MVRRMISRRLLVLTLFWPLFGCGPLASRTLTDLAPSLGPATAPTPLPKAQACARFDQGWERAGQAIATGGATEAATANSEEAEEVNDALEGLNRRLRAEAEAELVEIGDDRRPEGCPAAARYLALSYPDGQALGEIPIERAQPAAELLARARQLLRTPRAELRLLIEARRMLDEDRRALAESLGIDFQIPASARLRRLNDQGKERLHPFSMVCRGEKIDPALEYLSHDVFVRLFEFAPGRARYSVDSVYKRGELLTAFRDDRQAFLAQADRFWSNNLTWCPRPPDQDTSRLILRRFWNLLGNEI